MAFSIDGMLGTINANGGLSRSSKFEVTITAPSVASDLTTDLRFFCEASQLPGLSFQTDEVRPIGYGNIEKRPYATILQDVPLSFYCDTDGRILNFFHAWQQSVFNFNGRMSPFATSQRGLDRYTFAYPTEYFGTVDIFLYDEVKDTTILYTLHEAYPITVGDIQVSWNQSDQLMLLPVTMTYTFWTTEAIDPGAIDNRTRTRAETLAATQGRVDDNINRIREEINIFDPIRR